MNKKMESLLNIVNSDMLMDMVNEVNSWDGSLEHLNYIDMDMLEDYLLEVPAVDIINKVYYGDFNPNDPYFQFNAYANLVSYSEYEVEQELIDYRYEITERFMELYEDGHVETTYQEIYDILDDDIEEE